MSQMDTDSGLRCAEFLREHAYPGAHKAKRIAEDWQISPSLAKQWLGGRLPVGPLLVQMTRKWGSNFWRYITEEPGQARPIDEVLIEQLASIRETLTRLEQSIGGTSHVEATRRGIGAIDDAEGDGAAAARVVRTVPAVARPISRPAGHLARQGGGNLVKPRARVGA
jgi:hypothetical protein